MDIDEVEGTPAPQSHEWPEDYSPSPGRMAELDELATGLARRRLQRVAEEKKARSEHRKGEAYRSKLCWQMRDEEGKLPCPDAA